MAARSTRNLDTASPITDPITMAIAKPVTARRAVIAIAFHSTAWFASLHSSANAARGPGSTYTGFQPDQTTTCQTATTSARASSLGQMADHIRTARLPAAPVSLAPCRTSSPASVSAAMAQHLRTQPFGNLRGQPGHRRRLDLAGPRDVHRVFLDHRARAAAQQHHLVAQADRLAHVVGDEEHAQAAILPDPLELVVQ